MKLTGVIVILGICVMLNDGAHILMFMLLASESHKNLFWPLTKELVRRGHSVTFYSPFPPKEEIHGVHEVNPRKVMENTQKLIQEDYFRLRDEDYRLLRVMKFAMIVPDICKLALDSPETQSILKPSKPVDLVIIDGLMNDCGLGIAYILKSPFAYLNTAGFYSWQASATGNPNPLSVMPQLLMPYTDHMTFLERLTNSVITWGNILMYQYHTFPRLEALFQPLVDGSMPSFYEIQKNVSLLMLNSHFSIEYPKPLLPGVLEVGGMQCRQAEPLPKHLQEFVSSSGKDGFILFSFGTVVQARFMPPEMRRAFLDAFSTLPQKVLWKWETGTMEETLPSNVKLFKWLPQQDLLGHEKCRLFITHGGLLGQHEALYHGVPMLVIPFFGDQDSNAIRANKGGFAVHLELSEISKQALVDALKRLLTEPSARRRAREISKIYKDQPETPLERAAFWTEYVIRHGGAPHMRSHARNLPLYQYYLLDVITFIFVLCAIIITAIIVTLRCLMKRCCMHRKLKRE